MISDRPILPPERSSRRGAALIVLIVVLLSAVSFSHSLRPWAALAAGLFFLTALVLSDVQAVHLALFAALVSGMPLLHPLLTDWPYSLLIPFLLYAAVAAAVPRLRMSLLWMKPGHIDRSTALLMILFTLLAAAGLFLWERLAGPDLAVHLNHIPAMPVWLLPLAGLGFAVFNALLEELLFRGLIMQALDAAFGPRYVSVLIQAWLFGAMHFVRGFPNGWSGLVLAGIYGLMLGELRRRSSGMLAPWLTHAGADLFIFAILVAVIRSS